MTEKMIKVARLSQNATIPTTASSKSAGLDLSSAENKKIPAHDDDIVYTDLQFQFPDNSYGRIVGRSGLALKGISIHSGVVDPDYTGNVGIIISNHGNEDFEVKTGDRVAQLVCEKIFYPFILTVVERVPNDTERGNKGFGSSGIHASVVSAQELAEAETLVKTEKEETM